MQLVKIGNRIYNFDLLVDAEFSPPTPADDMKLEPARRTRLKLRFAAPQSDERFQYDGSYTGEEVSPYTCALYDEDAIEAWDWLYHETRGK